MKKKAVIWVSTVLYILISIAIIALVLTAVTPVINKNKDKALVEQSLEMLNELDEGVERASLTEGTQALVEIVMKKGTLTIEESQITWTLQDSAYMYSEPGKYIGTRLVSLTEQTQDNKFDIHLILNYTGRTFNLDYNGRTLQPSENPYRIFIKNTGTNLEVFLG
ncbi:MAG: hypothetical protein JSW08_02195 [archaeon]|nr:MAG: hypothetical protein JSW08_02195 [archaeon]